jgi:hypothetical protein
MGALDILESAAKDGGGKKKKSDVPTLSVKGAIANSLRKLVHLFKERETIEAQIEQTKEEILPDARKFHLEIVDRTSTVPATVKLEVDGDTIQIDLAKKQYCKVSVENEDTLRNEFGNSFSEYFTKRFNVAMKPEAITDKIIGAIAKAIGKDEFEKVFDVTYHFEVTDKFHMDRFLDKSVRKIADKVIAEKVVSPYKPSIRG